MEIAEPNYLEMTQLEAQRYQIELQQGAVDAANNRLLELESEYKANVQILQHSTDPDELARVTSRQEGLRRAMQAMANTVGQEQEKLTAARDTIGIIERSIVGTVREADRLRDITRENGELEQAITSARIQLETAERNLKAGRANIATLEESLVRDAGSVELAEEMAARQGFLCERLRRERAQRGNR